MRKILKSKFFNQSTLRVARELLGKYLVGKSRGKIIRRKITEVEAYVGPKDLASHAARGETPRNKPMFGPPGIFYIYLIYGSYWMINIVTEKRGYPAAVLIRGVEGVSGPGRVGLFFNINKKHNGKRANKKTGVWFEGGDLNQKLFKIKKSKRIGVHYAGQVWSKKPYRFFI